MRVKNNFESHKIVFDYQGAHDRDLIRLVSLKSWRFTCADPESNFTGLLTKLDHKDLLDFQDRTLARKDNHD
jgi:hypothetical protein